MDLEKLRYLVQVLSKLQDNPNKMTWEDIKAVDPRFTEYFSQICTRTTPTLAWEHPIKTEEGKKQVFDITEEGTRKLMELGNNLMNLELQQKQIEPSGKKNKRTMFKNVLSLLVTLVAISAGLDYLGYFPTNILTPESDLNIMVSSTFTRETANRYGETSVAEVFNPAAQETELGQLNLWLESVNGKTPIFTQVIRVYADNFYSRLIETHQYEIKPDQTVQIPLKFTPIDTYWQNKSSVELKCTYIHVTGSIDYKTKGKTQIKRFDKWIDANLQDYYNVSDEFMGVCPQYR